MCVSNVVVNIFSQIVNQSILFNEGNIFIYVLNVAINIFAD